MFGVVLAISNSELALEVFHFGADFFLLSPNHQNSFGDVPFSNLEQKRRRNKFQVLL